MAANSVKTFSKGDFVKGDFALVEGIWFEILRVNAKSLSVGALVGCTEGRYSLGNAFVYRKEDNPYSWTDRQSYDKVEARMSGADMAAKIAAAD